KRPDRHVPWMHFASPADQHLVLRVRSALLIACQPACPPTFGVAEGGAVVDWGIVPICVKYTPEQEFGVPNLAVFPKIPTNRLRPSRCCQRLFWLETRFGTCSQRGPGGRSRYHVRLCRSDRRNVR